MTACPSGVQYDQLIEATRAQIERNDRRPSQRPHLPRADLRRSSLIPGGCAWLLPPLWLYQKSGARRLVRGAGWLQRMLPDATRWPWRQLLPTPSGCGDERRSRMRCPDAPDDTPRTRVGVLLGCVQRVFFDDVNAATVRVLAAEGYEVVCRRTPGLLRRAEHPRGTRTRGAGATPAG